MPSPPSKSWRIKRKEVTDRDIESLVAEEQRTVSEVYHLDRVQVSCGDRGIPTAAVRLIGPDGQVLADAALGTGPVDAVYKAINRLVGVPNQLTEFTVKSVTEGIDAIGEVLIRIESDGITYTGRGADTDIIVASAKAYMNALNRLLAAKKEQVGCGEMNTEIDNGSAPPAGSSLGSYYWLPAGESRQTRRLENPCPYLYWFGTIYHSLYLWFWWWLTRLGLLPE